MALTATKVTANAASITNSKGLKVSMIGMTTLQTAEKHWRRSQLPCNAGLMLMKMSELLEQAAQRYAGAPWHNCHR
ncbi:MAG: hypothetical protein M0R02_11595 [Bacteroidales bacterium]|nr:hypothetical protein [Bacteroidales bacterium]